MRNFFLVRKVQKVIQLVFATTNRNGLQPGVRFEAEDLSEPNRHAHHKEQFAMGIFMFHKLLQSTSKLGLHAS